MPRDHRVDPGRVEVVQPGVVGDHELLAGAAVASQVGAALDGEARAGVERQGDDLAVRAAGGDAVAVGAEPVARVGPKVRLHVAEVGRGEQRRRAEQPVGRQGEEFVRVGPAEAQGRDAGGLDASVPLREGSHHGRHVDAPGRDGVEGVAGQEVRAGEQVGGGPHVGGSADDPLPAERGGAHGSGRLLGGGRLLAERGPGLESHQVPPLPLPGMPRTCSR